MAAYTYNDVRKVLKKIDFKLVRSRKHETWEKILNNGIVLQVRLSHKGKRIIPKGLFREILRQMGLSQEVFEITLRNK